MWSNIMGDTAKNTVAFIMFAKKYDNLSRYQKVAVYRKLNR